MARLRHIPFVAALFLAAPAAAQEAGSGTFEELGRDADRLLEELLDRLGPVLRDLGEGLEDLDRYEAPEILPNGDIIIRRKRPPGPPEDTVPPPRREEEDPPGEGDSGETDAPDVTDT